MEVAQRPQRDDLVVREATLDDLQCILELYAQLFSNTDQASENRRELLSAHYEAFSEIKRSPDSYVFVAESAGAVVGTIAISMIPNLSHCGRPWAVIENVVVDERARKSHWCVIDAPRNRSCASPRMFSGYSLKQRAQGR
ncbi:MAG: GNAT family N-acetyltransferase [Halobacteriota archaeon]